MQCDSIPFPETDTTRYPDLPSETVLQHMLSQADDMDDRAQRLYAEAASISARFEHGQPIILHHHSTRQAQRDRNRADDRMRHAAALECKATDLRHHVMRIQAERSRRQMIAHAPTIGCDDVEPGDIVLRRPGHGTTPVPYRVVKVNAKSVSVESGYSWTDRIPYAELVGVRKDVQP